MDSKGIEAWRGGVNPWQCDQMGHMNVRFYVAYAMEALAAFAGALGMPRAFTPKAVSSLAVREHHIRFLKEARAGEPLHLRLGVLQMDDSEASLLQVLYHSGLGQPAAAFHTRLAHIRASDAQAFPWSSAVLERAGALQVETPDELKPRSLVPGQARADASLARAEKLRMDRYGSGSFTPQDCDAFGRVSPAAIMARLGDGSAHEVAAVRQMAGQPLGVAVVEYRLAHLDWPGAGDRYDIRSGLKAAGPRRLTLEHWILDPESGRPWAVAEVVLVPFDLKARKALALPDEALNALVARVLKF
jgi:acyl-CoA thioester hydrolase